MKFAHKLVAASLMAAAASGAFAQKGETVKIAMIEGLSGPFANVGQNQLRTWQLVAEHFSAKNPAGSNMKFQGIGYLLKIEVHELPIATACLANELSRTSMRRNQSLILRCGSRVFRKMERFFGRAPGEKDVRAGTSNAVR